MDNKKYMEIKRLFSVLELIDNMWESQRMDTLERIQERIEELKTGNEELKTGSEKIEV